MRWLKKIENKFYWGIIGFVITLASTGFAFFTFYYDKVAQLTVKVVNETDVLDVFQPVNELLITFQGKDIQEENINLKIMNIRLENTGNIDILESYYDSNLEWGIMLEDASIIEVRIIDSNSEYLRNGIGGYKTNDNFVSLNKVIFERAKFVQFELLIIHSNNETPKISTIGKIVGMDRINVVLNNEKDSDTPFFKVLFQGNIMVHLIRAVIYFFCFVLLVSVIALISSVFSNAKEKSKKKKVMGIIKHCFDNEVDEKILNIFNRLDVDVAGSILKIIERNSSSHLNRIISDQKSDDDENNEDITALTNVYRRSYIARMASKELKELMEHDFIQNDGDRLRVSEEFEKMLKKFIAINHEI
ncbi:hypothetical protein ACX93W_05265 [Paenibacillus sp. CAU 1782]